MELEMNEEAIFPPSGLYNSQPLFFILLASGGSYIGHCRSFV
jgi:hypothetical protein